MFRNGLTIIELLVVLAIITIIGVLIVGIGSIGGIGTEYNAKVVEKWTDLGYDNNPVYRVQIVKENDDELITLNSVWVHNDLHKGNYYKFEVFTGGISKVTPLPQPVEVQNGLAEKP